MLHIQTQPIGSIDLAEAALASLGMPKSPRRLRKSEALVTTLNHVAEVVELLATKYDAEIVSVEECVPGLRGESYGIQLVCGLQIMYALHGAGLCDQVQLGEVNQHEVLATVTLDGVRVFTYVRIA